MNGALQRADILWRLGRLDEADRELDAMFGPNSGMGKPTPAHEHARALRRARVLLARNENQRAAAVARRALARCRPTCQTRRVLDSSARWSSRWLEVAARPRPCRTSTI